MTWKANPDMKPPMVVETDDSGRILTQMQWDYSGSRIIVRQDPDSPSYQGPRIIPSFELRWYGNPNDMRASAMIRYARNYASDTHVCRCCGKALEWVTDNHPIHTACIPNHWGKHAKGINASRCAEFSPSIVTH